MNAEAVVLGSEGIEVLLEQNILLGDVGEDEVNLGSVARLAAADDGADDLEHGGDARTASDHTEVTDHVGSVNECTLGALDADGLTDSEGSHVTRDVTAGVRLDEEVDEAGRLVAGHGGVGTNNLLGGAIGLGKVSTD